MYLLNQNSCHVRMKEGWGGPPDKLMFLHLCEYMWLGLYIDILHTDILHVGKRMFTLV